MFDPNFDSFDDLQCEDLYDESYIMDNDYYDDLTEFEYEECV